MGFFSSKSKASTTSTTTNTTNTQQNSLGDLSSGNIQVGGDYNPNGIVGEDLFNILDFLKTTNGNSQSLVKDSLTAISMQSSEKMNYIGNTIEKLTLPIMVLGSVFLIIYLRKK